MAEKVGIAMVGAGAFGQFCLRAFSAVDSIRIAAVVDTQLEQAQRLAGQYGADAYADMEPMLARPDIAVITLSTPPYLHGIQGLTVLKAGKHLFCEKPLAVTIDDAEVLIQAARANH